MGNLLAKNKVSLVFLLSGLVLIGLGFLYPKINQLQDSVNKPVLEKKALAIDVGGAVASPGVYEFTDPIRVEDAINKAGGFSPNADLDWVSKNVNLSQNVKDEMKVYIPRRGELESSSSASISKRGSGGVLGLTTGLVNINKATQAELDTLPGVGAVTSQKIIGGRPYISVNDLKDKKIVTKATFEKIKDLVKAE